MWVAAALPRLPVFGSVFFKVFGAGISESIDVRSSCPVWEILPWASVADFVVGQPRVDRTQPPRLDFVLTVLAFLYYSLAVQDPDWVC